MRILIPLLVVGVAVSLLPGCATPSPKYQPDTNQTEAKDSHHDADLARRENARAAALLDKKDDPAALASAEAALKAALAADPNHGPAHNNLGKVYYRQGRLYEAANEFEAARELTPGQIEPLNNLGLVYETTANLSESAGNQSETATKLKQAADAYAKAVALEPENVEALGNLARAKVRRGDRDASVRVLLNKLLLRDTRPEWLAWERRALVRLESSRSEDLGVTPATTRPD